MTRGGDREREASRPVLGCFRLITIGFAILGRNASVHPQEPCKVGSFLNYLGSLGRFWRWEKAKRKPLKPLLFRIWIQLSGHLFPLLDLWARCYPENVDNFFPAKKQVCTFSRHLFHDDVLFASIFNTSLDVQKPSHLERRSSQHHPTMVSLVGFGHSEATALRWPRLDCFQVRFLINAKGLSLREWRAPTLWVKKCQKCIGHVTPETMSAMLWKWLQWLFTINFQYEVIAWWFWFKKENIGCTIPEECRFRTFPISSYQPFGCDVTRFITTIRTKTELEGPSLPTSAPRHQHFPILPSICSSWVRIYPLSVSRNSFKRHRQIGPTSVFNPKSMLIGALL